MSASPMAALVVDPDTTLGPTMEAALPGIRWSYRPGPAGYSRRRGVEFAARRALRQYLRQLPMDETEVTARKAKGAVEAAVGEKIADKTWRRLRDAETLGELGWELRGARLHRKPSSP